MSLLRTPFFERHVAAGARLIDFGGWEMPVLYSGISAEHQAVRRAVGLFDVSHMGEVRVRGPQALAALEHLVCNRVADVAIGSSQYAALMNDTGGIVDDLFIYRLGEEDYLVCVNASNRAKDFAWMVAHNPFGADFVDEGDQWAQIAVQGRHGPAVVQALTDVSVLGAARGSITPGAFAGVAGCLMARTGYTGEDGFEVFIPAKEAPQVWDRVVAAGAPFGLLPIGLGARDTLRLEARNVLYGNDISDDTSPYEAGLNWIVRLDKGEFIGREPLAAHKESPPRRLIGLTVEGRIPRAHQPILNLDGEVVGEVTSGTRSPSSNANIALGYVKAERGNAKPGNRLQVDVRGSVVAATVVKGAFFNRDY